MLIGLFCKYTLLAQPERKNEPLRVCENAACLLYCAVKGHCSHTLCFNANAKAVNYVLQFTKSLKHLNSYFTEVGFLKWWFVFAQVGREESDFWLDGCMDEWGGHEYSRFLSQFSCLCLWIQYNLVCKSQIVLSGISPIRHQEAPSFFSFLLVDADKL